MRVLMLGWEFPPHISGGLGTACEGLTTGLAHHDVEVLFVVPHLLGGETAPHMALIDSDGRVAVQPGTLGKRPFTKQNESHFGSIGSERRINRLNVKRIPSFLSPYLNADNFKEFVASVRRSSLETRGIAPITTATFDDSIDIELEEEMKSGQTFRPYGQDIFQEVSNYTNRVTALLAEEPFDVIHAHDWMTYPAGVALAQLTGKPLVVHVHSLEFDRSGNNPNPQISQIEQLGLEAAQVVIAVSYYTRRIIHDHHGIDQEKVTVVHNGVYSDKAVQQYRAESKWPSKIVLFLGRITLQKGPDYFVEAASKVVPHIEDVLFVMAGSGDMRQRMIDRVAELGMSKNFYFPGFLKGQEVEEMFSLADVYVMPSVSEPFGIAALEAIKFETPVILSRQSGVSEVLSHALKVDFWDIDRMAELIINALSYSELREDMISMARNEVRRLHWEAAALKTIDVYRTVS